jgi:hypothetical protein
VSDYPDDTNHNHNKNREAEDEEDANGGCTVKRQALLKL